MASSVQPRGTCGHVKSPWDDHRQCLACCSCTQMKPCKVSEVWSSETWVASESRRVYKERQRTSEAAHTVSSLSRDLILKDKKGAPRKSSSSPSRSGRSSAPSRDRGLSVAQTVSTVSVAPNLESTSIIDSSVSVPRNKSVSVSERKKKSLVSQPESASDVSKNKHSRTDSSSRSSRSPHKNRKVTLSSDPLGLEDDIKPKRSSTREVSNTRTVSFSPSAELVPGVSDNIVTDKASEALLVELPGKEFIDTQASQVSIGGISTEILESYELGSSSHSDQVDSARDLPPGGEVQEQEYTYLAGQSTRHRAESVSYRATEFCPPGTGHRVLLVFRLRWWL